MDLVFNLLLNRKALKRTQMSHMPHIFKMKIFFPERLKDGTPRKHIFVNLFNVNNDYKYYTVLRGTTCVWKMQNIQQDFVLHAFKYDDELWNELS